MKKHIGGKNMFKEKIISNMEVRFNDKEVIKYNARLGVIKKVLSKKDNKEKIIYVPTEKIYKLFNGTYAEKGNDNAFREIDISQLGLIITKKEGDDEEHIISVRELKNKDNYQGEADLLLRSFVRR